MHEDASVGIWIGRLVLLFVALGVGVFFLARTLGKKKALASVQDGLAALRAGFAQTRAHGEDEPVCVVALHYAMLSVEPVFVGVTNHRILIVKGRGPMRVFPYDYAGEHLPAAEKSRLQKGFFDWSHGSKGYSPRVKNHPPFAGETWIMPPTGVRFADQHQNLQEFASRFYFRWFYGR